MPTIKVEQMMELENLYLVTLIIIAGLAMVDSVSNYQWKLKLVGASLMSNWVYAVSKYLPGETWEDAQTAS